MDSLSSKYLELFNDIKTEFYIKRLKNISENKLFNMEEYSTSKYLRYCAFVRNTQVATVYKHGLDDETSFKITDMKIVGENPNARRRINAYTKDEAVEEIKRSLKRSIKFMQNGNIEIQRLRTYDAVMKGYLGVFNIYSKFNYKGNIENTLIAEIHMVEGKYQIRNLCLPGILKIDRLYSTPERIIERLKKFIVLSIHILKKI